MKISRTPLRISFFGGGTDYRQYYQDHEGAILGTSINHYCYVMLHNGESWMTFDLPNKSGLGSSSAYTVGLLRVCTELDKLTISRLATTWEYDKTGGNVGAQDQHLCAMGGFHLLRFFPHGIRDEPVENTGTLINHLLLFDTHQYRRSGDIIAQQLHEMKRHRSILKEVAKMPDRGLKLIQKEDYLGFGQLLHEAWLMKRQLSKRVSTLEIDDIYSKAKQAGAIGGKILGAGGGGFIIFLVKPEKQEEVKKALSDLTFVDFKFEGEGTKLIYHD